ncbi:hypothetical protein SISNIDRAFT_470254 [Sistotremastrum niveocremeum HHB9708]|uniref:Mixed lineage kinase domain-containing protein n=1 Tax=Sistotremastrum niveocremeum HHB9708 TaxID=1314777 RepID=A0A164P109_9AGAM|nr:hypothetical protein SISNIDRAFT_470254 [Sistotremastrum niveocremeum HHB9708]
MPLSADTTSSLLSALKIVQGLGEAVPHGGILKAIAGVGIALLEIAERVRVNKEECADIARRAAEHISVLNRLDEEEELSDDLRERLERYHKVLEDVSRTVERIGSSWKRKSIFRVSSVQEETKECLDELNEAYQMYIFEFSIAADNKLTTLVNGMRSMSLRLDTQRTAVQNWDEPDEIRRIPTEHISFLEEVTCVKKRGYTIRIGHGKMLDPLGRQKAVIIELRRDLLHSLFARILGISVPSRRTKMIVVEDGTVGAYDHLKGFIGLGYLTEVTRIMSEFVVRPILEALSRSLTKHRQDTSSFGITEGHGQGRIGDCAWEEWEEWIAAVKIRVGECGEHFVRPLADGEQLRDGNDWFEQAREAVRKWSEEKTEDNARVLWDYLKMWSDFSETGERTENSSSTGEIGYIEGDAWHPMPLVHEFPVADPLQYYISASQRHDGEWQAIVGTLVERFTRWSFNVCSGEEIHLRTFAESYHTKEVFRVLSSFRTVACPRPCGRRSFTPVRIQMSILLSRYLKTNPHPFITSHIRPIQTGLYPTRPDSGHCRLTHSVAIEIFNLATTKSSLTYFESLEFLPIPDITYGSDLPFASISEAPDQQTTESTNVTTPNSKKQLGKKLLSVFAKKKKTTQS